MRKVGVMHTLTADLMRERWAALVSAGGGCLTILGGWGQNWKIRLEPAPAAGKCGDGCRPLVVGSSGSVWSMVKRGETHRCNAGLYAVVFFSDRDRQLIKASY
jgi:hypothetical protein